MNPEQQRERFTAGRARRVAEWNTRTRWQRLRYLLRWFLEGAA